MNTTSPLLQFVLLLLLFSCKGVKAENESAPADSISHPAAVAVEDDSAILPHTSIEADTLPKNDPPADTLKVNSRGHAITGYAKTLLGIPYLYGSSDPQKGFDCSGFITHVFNHFKIEVPRSSADFAQIGKTILTENALPGDLILFTGTDPQVRTIGHIGIVLDNSQNPLRFIHSSSGKAMGVTISDLNEHYKKRLVKVIRL